MRNVWFRSFFCCGSLCGGVCWELLQRSAVFCRLVLPDHQKRLFEKLCLYFDRYAEQIPVTFVLGRSASLFLAEIPSL